MSLLWETRSNVRHTALGEAGGVRQRSALRDAYPLRRTRVSWAESVWTSDATTRPRHHSGPVRGALPGTARVRETTALGGHGADRRYWPEPQFDRGTTPAPGAHGKESERCPSPSGVSHLGPVLGPPDEYEGMELGGSEADKRQ